MSGRRELTPEGERIVSSELWHIEALLADGSESAFDRADELAGDIATKLLEANIPHELVKSFELPRFSRASRYIQREFRSA